MNERTVTPDAPEATDPATQASATDATQASTSDAGGAPNAGDVAYAEFAARIVAGGLLTDPWLDGVPRFRRAPVVLGRGDAAALARVGRDLATVYDEAVQHCHDEPELLDAFFGLTAAQKAMFLASKPLWHGIARADVFRVADGWAVAELNCDTPTGEPEAVELGRLGIEDAPHLLDPTADLGRHVVAMLEHLTRVITGRAPTTVGIVYPTEFSEDLSLIRLYRRWFEAAGWQVMLGSPYNLSRGGTNEPARLFGEPLSLVVRHYKTDWWGERGSAWLDEELVDAEPLFEPLEHVLAAQLEGATAIANPFGAVLPQNKRTMAFFWEHIHRFTVRSQEVIRELVPVTSRLEALHPELLRAERANWVLKSDYGAEGDEVVIGREATPEEWDRTLALARPGRWVAQRFFEALPEEDGLVVNHGVFVVAGEPAGLYGRVHVGATDVSSPSVPLLVDPTRV